MSRPTELSGGVVDTAAWTPLGAALLDYHNGDAAAEIVVSSDLWEDEPVPVAAFYRPSKTRLPALEHSALEHCRGRVLDLGAGAGRHAIELERVGHEVVAVDPLPQAVRIMRDRGVRDARCGSIDAVQGEAFDTVLMLMHGIGIAGTVRGLGALLQALDELLATDGRIVFDSADLEAVLRRESPRLLADLTDPHRYIGEVSFGLRYRDCAGPMYPWLFIDPEQLGILAGAAGFDTTIVARGDRGAYLAVLERRRGRF